MGKECVLRRAFLEFDHDRDGTISKDELKKMLAGREVQDLALDLDTQVSTLMSKYTDSDVITYQQFLEMMGVQKRNTRQKFRSSVDKVIMVNRLSSTSSRSGKSA